MATTPRRYSTQPVRSATGNRFSTGVVPRNPRRDPDEDIPVRPAPGAPPRNAPSTPSQPPNTPPVTAPRPVPRYPNQPGNNVPSTPSQPPRTPTGPTQPGNGGGGGSGNTSPSTPPPPSQTPPPSGGQENGGGGGGGGGGSAPAAPGSPYSLPNPFALQDPAWWGNPNNQAALTWAQNEALNRNNWAMDMYNAGWGVDMDRWTAGQSNAALMADYGMGLNELDQNYYLGQLDANLGALGYMGDLYGGMNNSYNDMYGQMYYSDAMMGGSWMDAGANLANTYANTGLGYGDLQNQWDIANMQNLNDWYTNQARNQTDLQVATMQAFGRDQAPNVRFMQNWS